MRIIALIGPSNCGKTETLIKVYEDFISKGWKSTDKKQLGADPRDFSDIITKGDEKIAFYTMGDYAGYLKKAIWQYSEEGQEVLICACNDRFVTALRVIDEFEGECFYKIKTNDKEQRKELIKTDAEKITQAYNNML